MFPRGFADGLKPFFISHDHPPHQRLKISLGAHLPWVALCQARWMCQQHGVISWFLRCGSVCRHQLPVNLLVWRFKALAPKQIDGVPDSWYGWNDDWLCEEVDTKDSYKPRVQGWEEVTHAIHKSLAKIIDEEKSYSFRHYAYTPRGLSTIQLLEEDSKEINLSCWETIPVMAHALLGTVAPTLLPTKSRLGENNPQFEFCYSLDTTRV